MKTFERAKRVISCRSASRLRPMEYVITKLPAIFVGKPEVEPLNMESVMSMVKESDLDEGSEVTL